MSAVEIATVSEACAGRAHSTVSGAEVLVEIDRSSGVAPPRHIDYQTAQLDRLARVWLDFQGMRKATFQREVDDCARCDFARTAPKKMPGTKTLPHSKGCIVGGLELIEAQLSYQLSKALRAHPLWPWLSQFPGLGGAHTALVVGRIGDPRRYPGQRCTEGHYLPPLYPVGAPCPVAECRSEIETHSGDGASLDPGNDVGTPVIEGRTVCAGVMLSPRETTGVRSLWHWAGLAVDSDGRAPRKRKGVQCDWEPRARTSVMQPGGIAEQIVRLNVPVYADKYREAKARLSIRVAEKGSESENHSGDANQLRAADSKAATDRPPGRPLRPIEADRIARKIAAKAFLGDLLTEWKRITTSNEPDVSRQEDASGSQPNGG